MKDERLPNIIHLIKVKRFRIAAEKYIELRGGNPTDEVAVTDLAHHIRAKWNATHRLRQDLGHTSDEIAEEVLDSIEDYL